MKIETSCSRVRPHVEHTLKPFSFFRELFCDVAPHKHCLQIDPQVLNHQPALNYLRRGGNVLNPLLDLLLVRSIISEIVEIYHFTTSTRRQPHICIIALANAQVGCHKLPGNQSMAFWARKGFENPAVSGNLIFHEYLRKIKI